MPRGEHSAVAEIKHERLGEILSRCRGGVRADVVFRVEFPFKIPVMRRAECLGKTARPEQAAVCVSNCMGELVSEHVAQRSVAACPDFGEPRKRNTRDADVARGAVPLPAVGEAERNQMSIHSPHAVIVESVRHKLACHGGVRLIQSGLGYEVHRIGGVELRMNDDAMAKWRSE